MTSNSMIIPETPSLKPISGAFPYLNYLEVLGLSLGSVIEARQWLSPYGWKTRHILTPQSAIHGIEIRGPTAS